ncbi:PREDICTED: amine sulfotransferase [Myotis brandtii]|uniref:amine sulfotransferase n=1 Tax=Myotis brandtii TaxID=109478 RepID=UPI000704179E|nr:PREDICTED: amine sulfotransferase [Myotis brandtii]
MDNKDTYLLNFKDYNFESPLVDIDFLENLDDFEIRDDDVFIITYPKSGDISEFPEFTIHFIKATVSIKSTQDNQELKLFLLYLLQIIYIYRNPKDVMTSYFHFSNMVVALEAANDMEHFMKRFLDGNVVGSRWFDHIRGWYEHRHDFSILFMMYEEMKKDLRSSVLKISHFLEKELSEEDVEAIVKQSTFQNMKSDPKANYDEILKYEIGKRTDEGHFLRKGDAQEFLDAKMLRVP